MKDFKLKDNYMSALLYSQGWASGDVELMKTIQVFCQINITLLQIKHTKDWSNL